jgi:hypothetical protein
MNERDIDIDMNFKFIGLVSLKIIIVKSTSVRGL